MATKLTRYILFALLLGILAGWATNAAIDDGSAQSAEQLKSIAEYLGIVTALFLRLIKMIIAPLVFSTLVAGIAHMGDTAALGRIGLRSMVWFIGASLISLSLGLLLVNLLQPGVGLDLALPAADAASGIEKSGFSLKEFITHLVPASIFEAMSKNEILQIVIFSLFFGVAITALGEKAKPIVKGVEALVQVMLQVTDYVMRVAPIAVLAAVSAAIAEQGPGILIDFGRFIGSFFLGLDLAQVAARLGFREELAFPLRDDGRGDRVAHRVRRRAAHVEEGVHAKDEQQARLGDVELVQRRRDHHEGGARDACHALRRHHQYQQHRDLLAEGEVDAVGLRDENRRKRHVHHGTVEIERIAERKHEAGDAWRDAETVERFKGARVSGL